MNIHNELQILLDAAKNKNQLDLAFRIIACLAKLKPHTLSINTLSNEDITQLINECASITTHTTDAC